MPGRSKPVDAHTRAWRAAVLRYLEKIVELLYDIRHELRPHASRFSAKITSEPLPARSLAREGAAMPQQPISGTIDPNSRASIEVVPQAADGTPTALDGNLRLVLNVGTNAFSIDPANPLAIIVKVDPPPDIAAAPVTVLTIDDDADSDPKLEITLDWQQGTVVVKATQFATTISSEPIA